MTNRVTEAGGLALGVDVGGTAVKAGLVDLSSGALVRPPRQLATPRPPTVDAVVAAVASAVHELGQAPEVAGVTDLPIGVGLSGDVRDGLHTTGVNLDPSWINAPARLLLEACLERPVRIINDADAAGIGEMRYGAGRGTKGTVVVLTFGTGIGSAVFSDGHLLPNTGFGQFPFRGADVEQLLSSTARRRRGMSWSEWAGELSAFLRLLDGMLRPDLVIVGGSASEAWHEYGHLLDATPRSVPAHLLNLAGIVGAAAYAAGGVPSVPGGSGSDG